MSNYVSPLVKGLPTKLLVQPTNIAIVNQICAAIVDARLRLEDQTFSPGLTTPEHLLGLRLAVHELRNVESDVFKLIETLRQQGEQEEDE